MGSKKAPSNGIIHVKKARPTQTKVFDAYWYFASERQKVFMARAHGHPFPWTSDPIIQNYKFTNSYRASDRTSQYLIKNVIYKEDYSELDTIFRVMLFKLFNKIETWELLESQLGDVRLSNFSPSVYGEIAQKAINAKASIYSAAYIMPSGPKSIYKGVRKHVFHFELLSSIFNSDFPKRALKSKKMAELFKVLLSIESFGPFLAYQIATDLNYTSIFNFDEMEFVVPGPGAIDGIKKCFSSLGDFSPSDVITMMAHEQQYNFNRLNIHFQSLWGRSLQLIDCQNIFCEIDKYSRVAYPEFSGISGRTRIKQKFSQSQSPLTPWYPPNWKINHLIDLNRL